MTDRLSALRARPSAPAVLAAGVLGVGIALALSALMPLTKIEGVSRLPVPLGAAFAENLFGKATLGKGPLPGLGLHVGYVATATVIVLLEFGHWLGTRAAFGTALVLRGVAGPAVLAYVGWGVFGLGLGAAAALNL